MPSVRRAVVLLGCAAALAGLCTGRTASAQPSGPELASARQIFNEGKDLEKAGNYAAALDKFKKVAEVRITPQVRFHIALCEENLGKLVSALKGFELAGAEAQAAGSSAIEVAENAPARAESLRKRVAHIKIEVTGHLSKSKLTLDGAPLPPEKFGVDQLVDPGKHTVQLETDGAPVFDKDINLKPGGSDTIGVEVHDPDDAAAVPLPPGADRAPLSPSPSRLPAYAVGGAGIVALGAGGVLMALSQVAKSDVEASCRTGKHCDPGLKSEGDRGQTFYTSSFIVGGIGAAALATGVVLYVLSAPKKPKPTTGAALTVVPTFGGLSAAGRF